MSRFKKYISAALTVLVAMAFLAVATDDAQAGAKTRKGKSVGSASKPRKSAIDVTFDRDTTPASVSGARGSRRRTNNLMVASGDFNNDNVTTRRKSRILPYMEQDNIYKLRRP